MNVEEKLLKLSKKEYPSVKYQRVLDILKVILVDKETDPDKVIKSAATTLVTIEKYAKDKELLSQFLTEEEYNIFKQRVDSLLNVKEEIKNEEEYKIIKNIIDDIFNTRHKISEIYIMNHSNKNKIEDLFFKTDYLDKTFGPGMKEKVKNKIASNALIREKKTKNSVLIEDRWDVFVAKEDVYYLNQIDFRKLKIASSYLCSGADMDYVIKKYETSIPSIISVLSDLKLQEILKPIYYENLKRYINIERILISSELGAKKTLLFNIVHILNENNYDLDYALNYFDLPLNIFKKLLREASIFIFIDEDIRNNIKNVLGEDSDKKVK